MHISVWINIQEYFTRHPKSDGLGDGDAGGQGLRSPLAPLSSATHSPSSSRATPTLSRRGVGASPRAVGSGCVGGHSASLLTVWVSPAREGPLKGWKQGSASD